MKKIAILASLGALSLGVALSVSAPSLAQDNGKLEQLKEQGFARVAIANEPPYTAVAADGKVSGAGPDVTREIFKRLGVPDLVASVSEYGAMIPGLQAGRFDVVSAGLMMKPERCGAVLYSEPMLCDADAFLVKKGNPKGIQSYEDIAKNPTSSVGGPGGGLQAKYAAQAGVPNDRLIVVPDAQSGLKMVQDGRIDAYSLPILSINDLVKKANDPNLEVVLIKGSPVSCDGAAFKKGEEALRDAFNVELAKMKKSGEFAKIIEPYGFSAAAAMSTSTEKLCASAK